MYVNRIPKPIIVAISVFVLLPLVYKSLEAKFYYNRTPRGAGLGMIAYLQSQSWGLGPGGNETGIVVFRLNRQSARELQEQPSEFFARLAEQHAQPNTGYDCRIYEQWTGTPLEAEREPNDEGQSGPLTWDRFANRYGFGITIPNAYRRMVDRSFAAPGSYYSIGRCGLFIFMPNERTAAYMFAG
jgi:hypothetical protein